MGYRHSTYLVINKGALLQVTAGRVGSIWDLCPTPFPEAIEGRIAPLSDLQQPRVDEHDHRLRAVGRMKLAEHVCQVVADRALTDSQAPCYLLIG